MENEKKHISLFLLFPVLLCFLGCDSVYRILQKEGAEEKDVLGDIVPMESNPRVLEIQQLLKLYGYAIGNPDGVMGGNTRKAIENFQKDNALTSSRFVDYATWDMLHVFEGYGLVEGGKLKIAVIQKALAEAGMNPGSVDGKLGRKTQEAIIAFQQKCGLKSDGKIGFKTLWALAEYLPEPKEK